MYTFLWPFLNYFLGFFLEFLFYQKDDITLGEMLEIVLLAYADEHIVPLDKRTKTTCSLGNFLTIVYGDGGIGFLFLVDNLLSLVKGYGKDIQGLIQGNKDITKADIRAKAAYVGFYFLTLIYAQLTGEFEELHSFLEGDTINGLVRQEASKAWFFLILHSTNLHHSTIATKAYTHRLTSGRIGT